MIKKILAIVALTIASSAVAQNFPKYYPADGFRRTGNVDAVYADESRIVINDTLYHYSGAVVVHSMSSYRVSFGQIRSGVHVAYKLGSDNKIIELWLLPANYSDSRSR
jgi:hypothetical protein